MLDQNKALELFQKIRKYCTADDVEVLIGGGRSTLTRFANNAITQNVAEENYDISVRTVFGGRTARASTNKFDDDSLRRVVQSSEALARVQEPDADLVPMYSADEAKSASFRRAGAEPDKSPSRYFEQTAKVGPQDRAEVVRRMVEVALREKLTAAGVCADGEHIEALFNSRGIECFHRQTSAEASITMLAGNSSGWQKANSPDVTRVDAVALAEIAAKKARDSAAPQELAAGKYTVILEPSAVLDMIGFGFWDFGGLALLDQRSFLNNRIGTQLFGENITVFDDAYHPLQSGPAFDGEGVRRERIELIRNGVVKNVVHSRATAMRINKSEFSKQLGAVHPTGHGFPLPNEIGEMPMNIVFDRPAQPKPIDQMIAETDRGVLVTRFWYIREVEPYEKMLTGMTRDGTFLVENGKVKKGILNFRFNESLVHMLSNVEAMSEPLRASGEESFDMVVPAMKVKDFNFTEVTKF
jgi:predicted Zn-dependent protease